MADRRHAPVGYAETRWHADVVAYVDVGADFEAHRGAVESVSVLFDLYDGDSAGYAATGSPGEQVPYGLDGDRGEVRG